MGSALTFRVLAAICSALIVGMMLMAVCWALSIGVLAAWWAFNVLVCWVTWPISVLTCYDSLFAQRWLFVCWLQFVRRSLLVWCCWPFVKLWVLVCWWVVAEPSIYWFTEWQGLLVYWLAAIPYFSAFTFRVMVAGSALIVGMMLMAVCWTFSLGVLMARCWPLNVSVLLDVCFS